MEGICGTLILVVLCLWYFPSPEKVVEQNIVEENKKKYLTCVDRNVKLYHSYNLELTKEAIDMLCIK